MKKPFVIAFILSLDVTAISLAQTPYQYTEAKVILLTLTNLSFKTDSVEEHRIGLRKYGFRRNNYAVLQQARLPTDTTFYWLPTLLAIGQLHIQKRLKAIKG